MPALLIALAAAAGAVLFYLSRLEGKYVVRRSLSMNVDRQRVFDKVRDFTSWHQWSPWLLHEPDARVEFSEHPEQEGGSYSWDGKRIGAGTLSHMRFEAPALIEQRIAFIRPFRAVNRVWWEFAEQDGRTEVTWGMEGEMPFPLRFMTAMTRQMIAKDYDLGLALLRGVLDPAAERPCLTFLGETVVAPREALTIPFAGPLAAMVAAMQEGFSRLEAHLKQSGGEMTGHPFTAYHKVDPKTMYFECDMAVPVSPASDAGDFARKTLGGGRYFQVQLTGSYDFLELAWFSAMAHVRMRGLKYDRTRPALEVYENDPRAVDGSNAILTTLLVPVKGRAKG